MVADRNSGPLHAVPNNGPGYDYDGLVEYLKFVKTKFPEKTEASILLEPDTAYDTLVQVMDHVRVFEAGAGRQHGAGGVVPGHFHRRCARTRHRSARYTWGAGGRRSGAGRTPVAPVAAPPAPAPARGGAIMSMSNRALRMAQHHLRNRADATAQPHSTHRHPVGDGGVPAGVLHRGGDHPEHQGCRDSAVDRADLAEAFGGGDGDAHRPIRAGRVHHHGRRYQGGARSAGRAAARGSQATDAGRAGDQRARYCATRDHHHGGQGAAVRGAQARHGHLHRMRTTGASPWR